MTIYKSVSIISSVCDVIKGKSGRGLLVYFVCLFTLIRGDVPSRSTCYVGIAALRMIKIFLRCTRNAKPNTL